VAFGLFPVIGKLVFGPGGLSPLVLGAWRLVAGTAILLPLSAAVHGRATFPARSDLLRFTIVGWLGVALNQALYLEGLARSTPINATLVMCLIPVFTFALAAIAGQETFGVTQVAGLLIALCGTLALLLGRGFTLGRYGLGNLLMVANTLSYSGYLVAGRPLARRYPPLVVIAWSYALSLPFAPYFAWHARVMPEAGHPAVWIGLVYTIVFPTVLAYLLNMFALARVPASTTAIYIYVQPLITGLASWLVFREMPTRQMLLAVPALFVGIWLVSRRTPAPQQTEPVPS
jgi:drug/metabolite transporter (DMT)-like permease